MKAMMRTFKAGVVYFALVFGAGFALGSVRVPFLVPRIGERLAELIETPIMFVVIAWAARFVTRRFALHTSAAARLGAGLIALALLLAAELVLVLVLQGRSIGEYVASRDPVSGSVYLAMLVLFALMPSIIARLRSARADCAQPQGHGR
jgi:hypothetical protein